MPEDTHKYLAEILILCCYLVVKKKQQDFGSKHILTPGLSKIHYMDKSLTITAI